MVSKSQEFPNYQERQPAKAAESAQIHSKELLLISTPMPPDNREENWETGVLGRPWSSSTANAAWSWTPFGGNSLWGKPQGFISKPEGMLLAPDPGDSPLWAAGSVYVRHLIPWLFRSASDSSFLGLLQTQAQAVFLELI